MSEIKHTLDGSNEEASKKLEQIIAEELKKQKDDRYTDKP